LTVNVVERNFIRCAGML